MSSRRQTRWPWKQSHHQYIAERMDFSRCTMSGTPRVSTPGQQARSRCCISASSRDSQSEARKTAQRRKQTRQFFGNPPRSIKRTQLEHGRASGLVLVTPTALHVSQTTPLAKLHVSHGHVGWHTILAPVAAARLMHSVHAMRSGYTVSWRAFATASPPPLEHAH